MLTSNHLENKNLLTFLSHWTKSYAKLIQIYHDDDDMLANEVIISREAQTKPEWNLYAEIKHKSPDINYQAAALTSLTWNAINYTKQPLR